MTTLTMSLELDDTRLERNTTDKQSPSHASTSERQLTRFGLKSRTLRLDSPTTIEACKELGILLKDLKQKSIDDFRESKADEQIINVRFSHYMKKYNQMIKEVWIRKRQLTKSRKGATGPASARQSTVSPPAALLRSNSRTNTLVPQGVPDPVVEKKDCIVIQTSPRSIFHNTTTNGIKLSASSGNLAIPTPLAANFNKTLMYFRNSHNTNDTKDFQDLLENDTTGLVAYDESVEAFDNALAKEVSRFNKIKRQKQKEANDAFNEDIKRIQMVEEMKEREKKKVEREKKVVIERKKQEEERKLKAEEKLQKIRDMDLQYQTQKQEEKQKMQIKLDEVKKKVAEDVEERKRILSEREERLEEKRRIAEERRIRLKEEEQQRCDELKAQIQDKLVYSHEKHTSNIVERMTRAQFQIQKIEESVKKAKEKQEQDDKEHIQKLVQKLVKKEENFKTFQVQHLRELKRKEKEAGSKSARFFSHQADIDQQHRDRMDELTERFAKVQENLQVKKEEEIKNLKLKQEMNKLRIQDKQENFQRKRRQIEYEQNKILENEKYHQEKLAWLKRQKNIMQQARVEATIQSKIEKERIEGAVQHLSKLTSEAKGSDEINEHQKKILKGILTPEDYKTIEREEERKKHAKAEAEAKRKAERNGQNFNMQRL